MTDSQLIATVNRMRQAQRIYFSTRTSEALQTSKQLEREVDHELERRTNPQRTFLEEQPKLTSSPTETAAVG